MRWQKLLSKNAQNLFSLINLMKDLIWRKTDLAEELKIDVKTVDRHENVWQKATVQSS